jgi:hypothetical protein
MDRWMDGRWCGSGGGEAVVSVEWRERFLLRWREGVLSYLGGLRLDLTGTRERTVNLTHVGV